MGCNCIGHLGAGFLHINRTGDDTSGKVWERTRQRGVNTLAFRLIQHNSFFAADADCVGITEDIPWEKNREWLRLLSKSGTPLFVSVKPGSLNRNQESELMQAFARASQQADVAVPEDWMDTTCPVQWKINGNMERFEWYEKAGIPEYRI